MTNQKNNILNRKLPRFFGVFVLLASVATIFWLSGNVVLFESKAALGNNPKNVEISNISEDSFTVSYITDESVSASISYGTNNELGQVSFDVRGSDEAANYRIHYLTVKSLTPDTKYFFSIRSGDEVFQNDSTLYEVKTAQVFPKKESNATFTVSGKAIPEAGEASTEAIAYLRSEGSQLISTLLKQDGSYSFKLDNLLKKDLSGIFDVLASTKFDMVITDPTLKSNVSFFASLASPVPPVILSKDYDFALGSGFASTATATESAGVTGFPEVPEEGAAEEPVILTPKSDEKLKDQKPLFEGKALPNSDVEITIQSNHEIITTVQTDENGNWEYRPDTPLEPGEHTITVKTLSASGILQTLTRSFTVFAQGSQFTEPSISPTRSVSPTTVPTAIPTQIPTTTPTSSPIPTVASTPVIIVPTTLTSPIASESPGITTPPIPDSGSSAMLIGIIGVVLSIGIGGLIFLFI